MPAKHKPTGNPVPLAGLPTRRPNQRAVAAILSRQANLARKQPGNQLTEGLRSTRDRRE